MFRALLNSVRQVGHFYATLVRDSTAPLVAASRARSAITSFDIASCLRNSAPSCDLQGDDSALAPATYRIRRSADVPGTERPAAPVVGFFTAPVYVFRVQALPVGM